MFDFSIIIQNNTNARVKIPLLNTGGFRGTFNSTTTFNADLTGIDLTVIEDITLRVSNNAFMNFVAYTAPLLNKTIQGVADALNSLDIGIFWVSGNTIVTANSLFTYAQLIIGSATIPGVNDWTQRTTPANSRWTSVTYGNGLFVAVGSDTLGTTGRIMTSPDGINWTLQTSPFGIGQYTGVGFGGGMFVAAAGKLVTSPDGINWTIATLPVADDWWGTIGYGNGTFIALPEALTAPPPAGSDSALTSPDGINWFAQTTASPSEWHGIAYSDSLGLFVAVGGVTIGAFIKIMTSPDGMGWTGDVSILQNLYGVAFGNGIFVIVGNISGADVLTSPDGITWTTQNSGINNDWRAICFGNGMFVAVSITGSGNRVMTSTDGINWTARTSAADNDWGAVAFAPDIFVAVSETGANRVMSSGFVN